MIPRFESIAVAALLSAAGAAAAVTLVSEWVEERIEAVLNYLEPM